MSRAHLFKVEREVLETADTLVGGLCMDSGVIKNVHFNGNTYINMGRYDIRQPCSINLEAKTSR